MKQMLQDFGQNDQMMWLECNPSCGIERIVQVICNVSFVGSEAGADVRQAEGIDGRVREQVAQEFNLQPGADVEDAQRLDPARLANALMAASARAEAAFRAGRRAATESPAESERPSRASAP